MLCDNTPKGRDLLLCREEDARLWIGSSDEANLMVLFTDLATGRRTIVSATEEDDEWYCEPPELVVGHTYRVELVNQTVTPVDFTPYTFDGSTFALATEDVSAVNVDFVKVWESDGDTYLGPDQCLSIY